MRLMTTRSCNGLMFMSILFGLDKTSKINNLLLNLERGRSLLLALTPAECQF
jgi:hypothetical protein